MTEIQQSSLYATYLQHLGWQTPKLDDSYIFMKYFPFVGGFIKLQRISKLPKIHSLVSVLKKFHCSHVVVEPAATVTQPQFSDWCTRLTKRTKIVSPYLPTKTTVIDLRPSANKIFQNFSEAKRRAVRRALKNNLRIYKSTNIDEFIRLKNRSAGFLGFITTTGIQPLWDVFSPHHATILMDQKKTAGVLLLFWDSTAYYWLAAATGKAKKLFTPTLLVWEAVKVAKKRECSRFDFVGVWDERVPNRNKNWKGFTKFKEGFGGSPVYYPILH